MSCNPSTDDPYVIHYSRCGCDTTQHELLKRRVAPTRNVAFKLTIFFLMCLFAKASGQVNLDFSLIVSGVVPSTEPTAAPTAEPTTAPTGEPTAAPTGEPTPAPSAIPPLSTGFFSFNPGLSVGPPRHSHSMAHSGTPPPSQPPSSLSFSAGFSFNPDFPSQYASLSGPISHLELSVSDIGRSGFPPRPPFSVTPSSLSHQTPFSAGFSMSPDFPSDHFSLSGSISHLELSVSDMGRSGFPPPPPFSATPSSLSHQLPFSAGFSFNPDFPPDHFSLSGHASYLLFSESSSGFAPPPPPPLPSATPSALPSAIPSAIPSHSPTTSPTLVPTEAPSEAPTLSPTKAPTAAPSTASPTLRPTIRPTANPTIRPSAAPTVNGQTFKPTVRPSAAPTYDFNYAPHFTYKEFAAKSSAYAATANSYTFSSYLYKGQPVTGSCTAWSSFTANNLQLPFDDLEFTSLTMYASYYDFSASTGKNTTVTCTSAVELGAIVTSLQRKTVTSTTCGGGTWKVFQCNTANVLCIDCDGKCDSTTTCPGSAYVVNDCATCDVSNTASGAIVNAVFEQKILYPEFNAVPIVNSTRTKASVTVNVTAAGTIYCAALRPTVNLATVMQIRNLGSRVIATAAGLHSLTLSSLNPDTAYSVYCYSEDFAAHVMPIAVALATKVDIATRCCRSVKLTRTHPQIVQYLATSTRPEQQFAFALDSTPNGATTASVSLAKIDCTTLAVISATVTDISILPATFSFSDTSTSLTGSFVLRATAFTGCYAITVATSGSDSYASATATFELQSATAPPSVPVLSEVLFSDSGTALLFNFDSSTDRGSTKIAAFSSMFNCSLAVTFPGAKNAQCKWVTTSQLSATLATTGPQVDIGDPASVLWKVVRAACVTNTVCDNYAYMASSSATVATPDNALQPAVSLSTSTSISPCGDIRLDPTLSRGFGGRDWSSVVWSVSGSAIAENSAEIAAYLNANFFDTFSVATVPNSYLTRSTAFADSTYTITLSLTNFLEQTAVGSVTVKVNAEGSTIVPSIIISGAKDIVYRWQPLSIYASVTWPSCVSDATRSLPVSYTWTLFQGTALTTFTSTSLDKRYFKLPAFTLEASTRYLISVTASVFTGAETISTFVSSNLLTGQSGVRARIAGAAERTGSTVDDVVIDGSISQDIDYPTTLDLLSFTWTCTVYSPDFGAPCVGFVASTTSKQTIAAGTIDAQTYTIGLTVANAATGKTDATSVLLAMVENRIPSVVVSDTKTKYNPGDKITLGATITPSAGNAIGSWSSSSVADLDGIAVTPITRNFGRGSAFLYQLAIAGGSLTAGLSYTFQISAYYTSSSTNVATASVTIVMNAPPAGGTLAVSPPEGIALNHTFLLQTSRWTDDAADLPLMYVLSSYTVRPNKLNSIKTIDAVSYAETKLGQGLAENDFLVYCVASASDIYGSSATTTTSVKVTAPVSTDAVVDATSDAIDSALDNGDPTGVQQAVDGALSTVNSVDCAVPTECGSLNREKCSETPRTCGPCLDGYVGPAGDSNKECKAKRGRGRRLDGDEELDLSPKSCPGDCSSQGDCVFSDLYGNEIDTCAVSEPLCRASCLCHAGFFGKSCSLGEEEYLQFLGLREKLCVSIYKTTKLQDVTEDVISARALSISNILLDINQISDAALGNCTAALVETVIGFPVLSCQGNSFELISTALSNVVERGSAISEDLLVDVGTALTALTAGCQAGLSVGEDPTTLSTANVNLLAGVADKSTLEGSAIDAPQSDYDIENGITPATVEVDTTSLGDADTVSITVFQYTNNPNGEVTNSSKVSVLTTSSSSSGDLSTLPGVTLVLQNNEPIDYQSSTTSGSLEVSCFRYESAPYVANVTCSNGMVVNVTCPAYAKGSYNVTCPGVRQQPVCKTYNGAEFVVNPLCTVVSFDAHSTTCYCEGAATRRFLASGEEVATEYSSSFVAIATNFATTFTTAPTLSDVQNNPIILSTLAGVVGLFFIGMYFFLRWDRLDSEMYQVKLLKESKKKKKIRMVYQFFDSIFPDELRAGTWLYIFIEQLRSEHFLVRLFVKNEKDKFSRAVFWASAMGKLVAFLFMNSLVASVMYPDDGYCEAFEARDACVDAKTTGGMFDACKWRAENASCEFNPPEIDFLTSIILTLIVTMLTVPLDKIIDANVELIAQYFHYRELERKIAIDDKPAEGVLMRKFDEFSLAQTHRSTILRGARLDKARAHMDFVPAAEEASIVTAYAAKTAADTAARNASMLSSVLTQLNFKQYLYSIDNVKPKALVKRVEDARSEADTMCREMEVMDSTEEQEKYLMRQFIVNAFPLIQRGVVGKYFLKDYSLKRTDFVKNKELAAFVFLPLLLGFLIYYVYVFNLSIGSRATNMWLVVTFIGLAQDIFLLQPTKVFINFIVINGNVSKEVRQLCERLSLRSKLIMMRTHGMMRDADALIQHFNPACRVARMFPALPISRLLMSLNDHDLPQRKLPHPTLIPWAYFSTGVVALMLLPDVLQETALDISAGAIGDFGLIAFYFFARANLAAMIVIVVLVVVAIVAYTVWRMHQKVNERFHVAEKYAVAAKDAEEADQGGDSAPGSPARGPLAPQKSKEGADFDAGDLEASFVPVSDLFTAEEYHADDAQSQQDFGSVWGLNKNRTNNNSKYNLAMTRSGVNLAAARAAEGGEAVGAAGLGMDATNAPVVRSFKPEVYVAPTTTMPAAMGGAPKIAAVGSDEESMEQPSRSINISQESRKPAPRDSDFSNSSTAIPPDEEADVNQASDAAEEDFVPQQQSRGGTEREHQPSAPTVSAAASTLLDGPSVTDI